MTVSTRSLSLMVVSSLFFVNNAITTEATDENQKPTIEVVMAEKKESKDEQEKEQKKNEATSAQELMLQSMFGEEQAKKIMGYVAVGTLASTLEVGSLLNLVLVNKAPNDSADKTKYQNGNHNLYVENVAGMAGQFASAVIVDRILNTDFAKKYLLNPADEVVSRILASRGIDSAGSEGKARFVVHVVGAKIVGLVLGKYVTDPALLHCGMYKDRQVNPKKD